MSQKRHTPTTDDYRSIGDTDCNYATQHDRTTIYRVCL